MKVLILNDLPQLGPGGSTVEVADGYAKNYLIPRGLVIAATEQNLKVWKTKLDKLEKERAKNKAKIEDLAKKISAIKLVIKHKTGEEGKLFGAITAADIEEALRAQANLEVDRKKIVLDEPIKYLGNFQLGLKLDIDVKATINLTVEKDE